jgi:hypothetical protein
MTVGFGLGASMMGGGPFGSGTPATASAPPSDVPTFANYLNPVTRDYVIQDDGSNQRMPIVRHQVLMLLLTERGSAAEPDIGLKLPAKMDQSFEQRARQSVAMALEPIGDDFRLDSVPVERTAMGRADITVEFTDLTTGNAETITL